MHHHSISEDLTIDHYTLTVFAWYNIDTTKEHTMQPNQTPTQVLSRTLSKAYSSNRYAATRYAHFRRVQAARQGDSDLAQVCDAFISWCLGQSKPVRVSLGYNPETLRIAYQVSL